MRHWHIILIFLGALVFTGCQPSNSVGKQEPVIKSVTKQKKLVIAQHLVKEPSKRQKVAYVLNQTQAMGLPSTLAAVPLVESNYKTNTVSSRGAAGEWQLMPALAKQYGISRQQRFNFPKATHVALTYLKDLHEQFGTWELAFAAYNAGENKVAHALAKRPYATQVNQLDLPKETKRYVAKIMSLNHAILSV